MMKPIRSSWRTFGTSLAITMLLTFTITGLIAQATKGQQEVMIGKCVNDSYVNLTIVNDSGDLITLEYIQCPYGCMNNSVQYGDDCKPVETENVNYNLVLFFIGMGSAFVLWNIRTGRSHPLRVPAAIIVLAEGAWLAYTTMIIIGAVVVIPGIALVLLAIEELLHNTG